MSTPKLGGGGGGGAPGFFAINVEGGLRQPAPPPPPHPIPTPVLSFNACKGVGNGGEIQLC